MTSGILPASTFPDPVKILIANTLYYPDMVGGAEVSTRILAEGLVAAGHEVSVVCATGTGIDRVSELNGVKIHHLRFANLYWPHQPKKRSKVARLVWHAIDVHNVIMARKLKKLMDEEKYDVINTNNLSCLSIGMWRMANDSGVPVVHTMRDYYLMCPTSTMYTHDKACERQCNLCAVYAGPKRVESARVDVAVGVSQFVLQKHVDNGFFPRAAQTVISNCYVPLKDATPAVRAPRKNGDPVQLGILGRVSPEKGIELVLDQLLKDTTFDFDWTLSIGGKGDAAYLANLKAKYDDPRVKFLGHVVASQFLDSIDILVVPSIWNEPFGRVTVEAYSHGVPVVGANTGGIPEVLEPESALVFDIKQPHTVIGKIRDAVEMLKNATVHDRLLRHAQTYNPDAMVGAYLDVFDSALAKQNALNKKAS
jgi:glycosyltransferase involved in cell wall biosynthesis